MPNGTTPFRFGEDMSTVRDRWHREHRTMSTEDLGDGSGDELGVETLPVLAVLNFRDGLLSALREACACGCRYEGWLIAKGFLEGGGLVGEVCGSALVNL